MRIYVIQFNEGQGADLVSKSVNYCFKEGQKLESKCECVKMRGGVKQDQGAKSSNSPLAGLYPMYSTSLLGAPAFQPYQLHQFILVLIHRRGVSKNQFLNQLSFTLQKKKKRNGHNVQC